MVFMKKSTPFRHKHRLLHHNIVVNGPTSSGPNPARTQKYKPEPEN